MAREFMPKSGALMPYVVVNRDAAVSGVFTVDGEGGSVDLTGKYVQITNYNQRVGSLEAQVTINTGDITNLKTSVSSINGSITTINTSLSGKAAKGVNSDITALTALSGPLRLGGDAASDYDAVTLKQLVAASGGSGGASMSGVMNNFLGAVEWFNGSRAKLPSGHLAADGQVLNRADYPDIWNAINSGLFVSVTDTAWLADADGRAKYSTGNGTTTFRMPDLNGAITSGVPSVRALFLRGDQGLSGGVGSTGRSVAPNIAGTLTTVVAGQFFLPTGPSATGALSPIDSPSNVLSSVPGFNTVSAPSGVQIDASKSSSVYTNGATEVRPNFAAGIWIIRVNGKFSASNTNFNVITGDAELPANNTIVYGGDVRSVYQVAGVDRTIARLRSKETIGGTKYASIAVDGGTNEFLVAPDGGFVANGDSFLNNHSLIGINALSWNNPASARTSASNMGFTAVSGVKCRLPMAGGYFVIQAGATVVSPNSNGDATISYPETFTVLGSVVASSGDFDAFTGNVSTRRTDAPSFDVRCRKMDGTPNTSATRINWLATGFVTA